MKTKKLEEIMTEKDKKNVEKIIKKYEKTFRDLGEYDKKSNKEFPLFEGCLKYFPNALRYVSHVSLKSNEQHNPGEPLHWAKEKSTDEPDALLRHLTDYASGNKIDDDGIPHLNKVCWRALALLQIEKDNEKKLSTEDLHAEQ